MGKEILVKEKVDEGLKLIQELDKTDFRPDAALWFYYSDSEKWKLVLAGKSLDGEKYSKFMTVFTDVLRKMKPEYLDAADVRVVGSKEPFIKNWQPIIHMESGAAHFSNNYFNGLYVEDAIVHRMTPAR